MNKTCRTCDFCIQDDGEPYCIMKDLYTTVNLNDVCDETTIRGELYWTEKKEGAESEL